MNLEFTTTACNRPELLYETYASFSHHLKGVDFGDCLLHLNVDPLPGAENREEVVEVAEGFFGEVNYRMPDEPNFAAAVRWTWDQVATEFFFNLEDDWNLLEAVHIRQIERLFRSLENPPALQVILRHSRCHGPHWVKNKPEAEHIHDVGLPPMIARRNVLTPCVEGFSEDQNPEKWFREWYSNADFRDAPYMWPSHKITADIGREWREERNLTKKRVRDEDGQGEPGNWNTWKKQQS